MIPVLTVMQFFLDITAAFCVTERHILLSANSIITLLYLPTKLFNEMTKQVLFEDWPSKSSSNNTT